MTFPHYFHLFGLRIHPHPLMELLAYSGGFQLYLFLRRRWKTAIVPFEQNMWIIVAAVFGALAGSKLLAWWESINLYAPHWRDPAYWIGGKTIVGGLLGGWIGVEFAKKRLGIRYATGDVYVFPLILGMSVGRIGCFLTGLDDHTCGSHTTLPWSVNFGDGTRHPAQLYDIAFLLTLGLLLALRMRRPYPNGRLFRWFLMAYLSYRFSIEFLKDRFHPYLGLSAIQLACVGGCFALLLQLARQESEVAPNLLPAPMP